MFIVSPPTTTSNADTLYSRDLLAGFVPLDYPKQGEYHATDAFETVRNWTPPIKNFFPTVVANSELEKIKVINLLVNRVYPVADRDNYGTGEY